MLLTFKRSFSKKMGKNRAHTLSSRLEVNIQIAQIAKITECVKTK